MVVVEDKSASIAASTHGNLSRLRVLPFVSFHSLYKPSLHLMVCSKGRREVLPALPWARDDNAAIVERLVSLLEESKIAATICKEPIRV